MQKILVIQKWFFILFTLFYTVLQPSFQMRSKVVHSGLKDESQQLKLIHSNLKL